MRLVLILISLLKLPMSEGQESTCFALYTNILAGQLTTKTIIQWSVPLNRKEVSQLKDLASRCGTPLKPCCYPTAATRSDTPSA